jgi:precorrin-4 methylase
VLTVPKGLRRNEALLKAVAKNGETLAIFMGLHDLPKLVPLLQRHYVDATPMRLVYDAGISSREHQLATTLGEVLEVVKGEKERFLGLVYIGPCLAGE